MTSETPPAVDRRARLLTGSVVALVLLAALAVVVAETRVVGRGVPLVALLVAGAAVCVLLRREQRSAREREEHLDRVFRLSQDMLCIASPDGRFLKVNPAFERVLGWTEAELLARPFLDFVHPEDRERTAAEAARLGQGHPTVHFQNRYRGRDGGERWLSWSATPDPRTGLIYARARDVTEELRAAEDLRRARDAAEAAARARSTFLASMSHEIRTPLNAVIGMGGLLLETPLTPLQREYAQTLRSGGEALLSVVDGILDYSKLESGELEIESLPFSPAACLEDALAITAPRAAAAGIELTGHATATVPPLVLGDESRLRQVLVNLLGNAVKFTERGEVEATVDAGPDGADGIELRCTVRDTGIGIPPERLDRLFRPFSQVDASTTRRYGGTGLGLAICRELCERMGGRIAVASAPGEGTTFRFTVRVGSAEGYAPSPPAGAYEGRRALVVAPVAGTRRAVAGALAGWGIDVHEAADGASAMRVAAGAGPLDVALLDGGLAAPDGRPLLGALREVTRRDLPGILLVPLGVHDAPPLSGPPPALLTKPVRRSALHDALATAVGIGETTAALAGLTAASPGSAPARARLRILVAEDNPMNREVGRRLLESLGCSADFAVDGMAAVEAEERARYDVVFLDLHMPRLDGLDAARRIRARHGEGPRPRLIALTASALREDRDAARAAGMDGFLAKPLRPADLRHVLDDVATGGAAVGTAGRAPVTTARSGRGVPALDPAALAGLREIGGDALVAEVAAACLSSLAPYADRIRDGCARRNAGDVREAAHALLGSALTVGATSLSALAGEVERAAAAGDVDGAVAAAEGLDGIMEATADALRALAGDAAAERRPPTAGGSEGTTAGRRP